VGGAVALDGLAKTITVTRFGQNGTITFMGTAGQSLGMGINSRFAGRVTITASDGSVRLGGTAGNFVVGNANGYDLTTLTSGGTYSIFIDPTNGATGAITFTLSTDLNAGSVAIDGAAKPMTITRFGQNGVLTFTGTVGQRVGMGIASKIAGRVTITAPNGSLLLSGTAGNFSAVNTNEYDLSALSGTGTYTLFVLAAEINGGVKPE
jgi:hypothetical protein